MLHSWSIALFVCSFIVVYIVGLASITAVKVLLYWDRDSDSERQIELEGKTWLSAALIQYALVIEIISLLMLVMAAEDFSGMIAGAMCATGSFLANGYGTKILYLKIAGIFLYGFWIVLHRLDMQSEFYSLLRVKYIYLLTLAPLVFLDAYWLFLYIYHLEPDVVTSCCGVIYGDKELRGNFLSLSLSENVLVTSFYGCGIILLCLGAVLKIRVASQTHPGLALFFLYGAIFVGFFFISLLAITTFFSSYIYALPSHNCPFDMLKAEYFSIGYPIYLCLFGATFLAVSGSFTEVYRTWPGMSPPVCTYQRNAFRLSFFLLLGFLLLVSYPLLAYVFLGGET